MDNVSSAFTSSSFDKITTSPLNLNTASIRTFATIAPSVDAVGSVVMNETITATADFSDSVISTGGVVIFEGSMADGNTIYNGGILSVTTSATIVSNTVSGGSLILNDDAIGVGNTVYAGGSYVLGLNAIAIDDIVYDGGTMVLSGGLAMETVVSAGGNLVLLTSGYLSDGVIDGGNLIINNGAELESVNLINGGTANVSSGAILRSVTIGVGGNAFIHSGVILSASTESDPTTTLGVITVNSGGSLSIDASVGATVDLSGAAGGGTVVISGGFGSGTTTALTVINGFAGTSVGASDKIIFAGLQQQDIAQVTYPTADQITFTLKDGSTATFNVSGIGSLGYELGSDSSGNVVYEVCFLAGTMIKTALSTYKAIENIQIGDEIVTYDWKNKQEVIRPVVWAGTKHVRVNSHASDDTAGYPVRILQGAIAENVPNKDLLVTPEHSLFFDSKFIPARMLVNGYSIYYDRSITSYDYYHIETEEHSVIIADGMMTESFLDTGNRKAFAQTNKVVSLSEGQAKSWERDAAAPLTVAREMVEPIFRQIEQRAHDICNSCKVEPLQLTDDADLHLVTDKGEVVRNHAVENGSVIFTVPANTQFIKIMSRVGRPSETIGAFVDDRRYLGVLIGEITVSQVGKSNPITLHHHADQLLGWHVKEAAPCRWTDGEAVLPLPRFNTSDAFMKIKIQIIAGGPYFMEVPRIVKKTA